MQLTHPRVQRVFVRSIAELRKSPVPTRVPRPRLAIVDATIPVPGSNSSWTHCLKNDLSSTTKPRCRPTILCGILWPMRYGQAIRLTEERKSFVSRLPTLP